MRRRTLPVPMGTDAVVIVLVLCLAATMLVGSMLPMFLI